MSLSSCGMFGVGVALVGVMLLAIFSMLAMAHKQDEDQDRLEIALRRESHLAYQYNHKPTFNDIRVSVNLNFKEGGVTKT